MQASLIMYNPPQLQRANGEFWRLIRGNLQAAGINAPEQLNPDGYGQAFWSSDDLVFSQTCGMPYRVGLHGKVQIIGTPHYDIEDCQPGYYYSCIIKRKSDSRVKLNDFNASKVAVNSFGSQSGYAALATEIADQDIRFSSCLETGSHLASAQTVAAGDADLAATDAVTLALIQRYETLASEIEVIARTSPTPGLPFICSTAYDRQTVADAVTSAIDELAPEYQKALMLRGLVHIPAEAYLSVPTPSGADAPLLQGIQHA